MSTTVKKQIELMEDLVDLAVLSISEQSFSAGMASARVKGEANVEWTNCYERRCNRTEDKYERKICTEMCKRDSAANALNRIRGLKSYCPKSRNPEGCMKSLRNSEDAWNDRVTKIDDRIADIKRLQANMKRKS